MNQQFWPDWVQKWQHSPFKGILVTFLEGSGPLRFLLGQFMLAGTVFVNPSATERWLAAAEMLEDDRQSRAFAALLNEEYPH